MAISILCKELVEKDFVVVDDFCSKKDCARLRDFIVEKRTQDKMLSGTWNTTFFFKCINHVTQITRMYLTLNPFENQRLNADSIVM